MPFSWLAVWGYSTSIQPFPGLAWERAFPRNLSTRALLIKVSLAILCQWQKAKCSWRNDENFTVVVVVVVIVVVVVGSTADTKLFSNLIKNCSRTSDRHRRICYRWEQPRNIRKTNFPKDMVQFYSRTQRTNSCFHASRRAKNISLVNTRFR